MLREGDAVCRSEDLRLVYVRKPAQWETIDIPKEGSLEHWCREEIDAVWRSIHDYCHALGKVALVHPGRGAWGKVRQMWVAKKHFAVPEWRMVRGAGAGSPPSPMVVKANTGTLIGGSTFMSVREARPEQLDPQYPWFFQSKVPAKEDVTVAYVRGELFAYALNRALFTGVDCRRPTAEGALEWTPCRLTPSQEAAIRDFMAETGLSYGRLDFLRSDENLWFLEVNPNGMWAWLDLDGSNGLLDAIVRELRETYRDFTPGLGLEKMMPVV